MAHDVAVVGAGVFGAWTAWHLRQAGASVLLLDAWAPGHSRASSGDETRIVRTGYGADEIYTRMARQSLAMWRDLGGGLFQPTGVLFMARHDHPYSQATLRTLTAAAIPHEIVDSAELARRYPQMRLPDPSAYGIFEPESGVVFARRAVAAIVAAAVRNGVEFATAAVAPPPHHGLRAGTVVYACGPWLPKLFLELLGNRIFPTRQEVFYFATPAGDARFRAGTLPPWVDFTDPRGPYGIPELDARGFKVAFDLHGPAFDPDTGDRRVTSEGVAEARRFLRERFPQMAEAVLAESRVCQYENTSSGDFLIDRHPELQNVWLVGGGSGHGFKHGPAVGKYLAERILENSPEEPRFSLATKQVEQNRSVY